MASAEEFTQEELRSISERAKRMAVMAGDPSLRTALQLLAEAAEMAARKLPR